MKTTCKHRPIRTALTKSWDITKPGIKNDNTATTVFFDRKHFKIQTNEKELKRSFQTFTAQWSLYVPYSDHYMYRQIQRSAILRSAHTVYLCVLCGSENKQRLFPYTALTDWFL